MLGNLEAAKDSVARALRRPDLENDSGLVDRLIDLYTNGKVFQMIREHLRIGCWISALTIGKVQSVYQELKANGSEGVVPSSRNGIKHGLGQWYI